MSDERKREDPQVVHAACISLDNIKARKLSEQQARLDSLQKELERALGTVEELEPEKLRFIAKSLDVLTGFVRPILEADLVTVDGEPLGKRVRETLLEWVNGTAQQDDLRRWADSLSPHSTKGPENE